MSYLVKTLFAHSVLMFTISYKSPQNHYQSLTNIYKGVTYPLNDDDSLCFDAWVKYEIDSNNVAKVSYVPKSQKYITISVLNSNKDTVLTKFLRNKHYKNYCRVYIPSLGNYNDIPFKFSQIAVGDSLVTDQELDMGYRIISMEIRAAYSTKSWDGDSRFKVFHSKNNVFSRELLDSISYYGNVSALSIRSVGRRQNEPPSRMNSIFYLFE